MRKRALKWGLIAVLPLYGLKIVPRNAPQNMTREKVVFSAE
jgi:hypothetical protein